MSRAHAVAPMVDASTPLRRAGRGMGSGGARVARQSVRPSSSFYLERALLLWPRLDRAKIRRYADDPARIAEIVERRTSQPFDVILAMLTRQSPALGTVTEVAAFDATHGDTARIALRILHGDAAEIVVQDLLPA